MGTTEVQRTLVKSPPELWAELSDQDSLARHLSELGEIRITSTVSESAVHWESEDATGTALIQQAGWGTKVTLAVTVSAPEPVHQNPPTSVLASAHAAPASPPTHLTAPTASTPLTAAALRAAAETTRSLAAEPEPEPEPSAFQFATTEPDGDKREPAEPQAAEPEPTRRGFFSRLFGARARRRRERDQQAAGQAERPRGEDESADEAHPHAAESVEPVQPTALEALEARFASRPHSPVAAPAPETPPEPSAEAALSSELRSAEEVPAGEVKATLSEDQLKEILTGVLDRLGAAHHRPFSRA